MVRRPGLSRGRRIAARTAGLALVGVMAAFACGPGDLSDLTRGRGDSGRSDATAPSCPDNALAPAPPPADTPDPPAPIPVIHFAVNGIRLDNGDYDAGLPKPLGIDLDNTCQCNAPPSCVAPPDASPPPTACPSDGGGGDGRDNVAGPFLATLSGIVPGLTPTLLTQRVQHGVFSIIFTLQDWNGTTNDPKVTVQARTSPGTHKDSPDAALYPVPVFDGNDVWDIDPSSILDGTKLTGKDCNVTPCVGQVSQQAYVVNRTLVAKFDTIPLTIVSSSGNFVLPFAGATLTATLTSDGDNNIRMLGEISGRMPAAQLLQGSFALESPLLGAGNSLCQDQVIYAQFKSGLCRAVDLMADPSKDHAGQRCNAISETMGFSASVAKIGVVTPVAEQGPACPIANDSCF